MKSASVRRSESVVTIPQPNPAVEALKRFELTILQHAMMHACVAGIKPADCTASQRRALRQLEAMYYVRLSERTGCWVLSELGEVILEVIPMLMRDLRPKSQKGAKGRLIAFTR